MKRSLIQPYKPHQTVFDYLAVAAAVVLLAIYGAITHRVGGDDMRWAVNHPLELFHLHPLACSGVVAIALTIIYLDK